MHCNSSCSQSNVSRRQFVAACSAASVTMLLGDVFPGRVRAQDQVTPVRVSRFPAQPIASLNDLEPRTPVDFRFPTDQDTNQCILLKLEEQAGGGIGPDLDIVAFHTLCTHMGGDMLGTYVPEHSALGPCPEHLTTFDLTRHGIVVAGHATQAIPQIILELDEDQIIATGIVGLFYGVSDNADLITA